MGLTKLILKEILAFFMPFSVSHKDEIELITIDGCWVSMVFYWPAREPGIWREKVNFDTRFLIIKENFG